MSAARSLRGTVPRESGWTLFATAGGEPSVNAIAAARHRLLRSVRVGHAAGVAFRCRFDSGPDATPTFLVADPMTSRWFLRELSSAYDHGRWRPASPVPPLGAAGPVWHGAPRRSWPEPLRATEDELSLYEAIRGSLRSLPRGLALEWSFRPAPLDRGSAVPTPDPPADPAPERAPSRRAYLPPRPVRGRSVDRSPVWECRCVFGATEPATSPAALERAARAIGSASRAVGGNMLLFRPRRWWRGRDGMRFPLHEHEVVSLLPSPVGGDDAFVLPEPSAEGWRLPIGRRSDGRVVGPWIEPAQGRHVAVLGETGMGKSSLLVALARRAVCSAGLVLFDPLGETADDLCGTLRVNARDRVVRIAPTGDVRLNALEGLAPVAGEFDPRSERRRNDLVHALRRVRSGRYVDSGFWGPRLEEMITRAVGAAALLPGGTLVEAHTLLAAEGRGFRVVPPEAAESVRALADRIRVRPEDADGARRLLYEVVRSAVLVRTLCAPQPTMRPSDLVAPGRIVVLSGEAGKVGESTARYFLAIYLALIWAELLARPVASKTFVVVDEAQWFVHESLAEMLRLGRRGNVHVVLATQAIASLPESVAEAAWTNVADFVAFRGSPDEAREFSRVAPGVRSEALLALPRGEAALLLGKGGAVEWVHTVRVPRAPAEIPVPGWDRSTLPAPEAASAGAPPADAPTADGSIDLPPGEAVLAAIGRRLDARVGAGPVRVPLDELRREVDPSGRGVREVGGRLGRSGAIVRTGRDGSGTCWWIDPERWERSFPTSAAPGSAEADASPPQPS
jgi:hypothetical protein